MPTRSRFPAARTALLLVDVINPFDFPGGAAFARRARRAARAMARLRARASASGVPVIYVNDNLGRWRSSLPALVDYCTRDDRPGAGIARLLEPADADYVVLKSTLSGFYQTPLETMLRTGGVRTVVLAGFAADNCVLFTAADAYMRDFRVVVPSDCVESETTRARRGALGVMQRLFGAKTTRSPELRLVR